MSRKFKNWEDVKIQAAIAILPKCYEVTIDILKTGSSISPHKTIQECAASNAVIYADELVKHLQQYKSTDYYNKGYDDALHMMRKELADKSNNYDRLAAIRRILDEEEGLPDGELKVVQIDGASDDTVLQPVENPAQSILQFMSMSDISVEELKAMSKDDANKHLSKIDKMRWVELHNAKAGLYCLRKDKIEDVPVAGWWK